LIVKAQTIRLADVFVIGPLMFWGGRKLVSEHPWAGGLLMAFGAATVAYNGANYMTIARGERTEPLSAGR
jgi:hypothetical protein